MNDLARELRAPDDAVGDDAAGHVRIEAVCRCLIRTSESASRL